MNSHATIIGLMQIDANAKMAGAVECKNANNTQQIRERRITGFDADQLEVRLVVRRSVIESVGAGGGFVGCVKAHPDCCQDLLHPHRYQPQQGLLQELRLGATQRCPTLSATR